MASVLKKRYEVPKINIPNGSHNAGPGGIPPTAAYASPNSKIL
jgi:hypothetical protein